jgi:hypothetical protein
MTFRVRPDIDEVVTERGETTVSAEGCGDMAEKRRIASLLGDLLGPAFDVEAATARMITTTTELWSTRRRVEKRPMTVGLYDMCELSQQSYKGRYFLYLMSHSVISKTDSHVCYSTNPLVDIFCHNRRLTVNRNTCMAAPHWMIDIVIGPFASKEQAIECGRIWVSHTRGKESKRDKAEFLASISNVDIYSFKEKSRVPLEELLARDAPCEFVEIYSDIVQEYDLLRDTK